MKVSPHFLRLYYKTVRRYKKLSKRLKNQLTAGQFQQKSDYAQRTFLHELQKLRKKLLGLRTQIKLAAAAGVAALVISATSVSAQQTNIGPFAAQSRTANPLRGPLDFDGFAAPAAGDLDNDGDLDFLVGNSFSNNGNNIRYYRNVGTAEEPFLQEETYYDNPLFYKLSEFDEDVVPSIGDLDGDGDLDVIVGTYSGEIIYFENTGTTTTENDLGESFEIPLFVEKTAWDTENLTGNFFSQFDFPNSTAPLIVDFDNDGDNDLIVGGDYDYMYYESNIKYFSQNEDGTFTQQDLNLGMFNNPVRPETVDIDTDGDLDIVLASHSKYGGDVKFFLNQGIVDMEQVFEEQTGEANPFGFIAWSFPHTELVDLNNDGALDLVLGIKYGTPSVLYYTNNGDDTFTQQLGLNSPFDGVHVDNNAAPEFVDVDEDGFMDVVIAAQYPGPEGMLYLRNNNGVFEEVSLEENPFADIGIPSNFTPSFIDLDGDGLTDIAGASSSGMHFFKRLPDGSYEAVIESNPFANINGLGDNVNDGKSDFADIDNDGDFDLFVSEYLYSGYGYSSSWIRYFRNTGDDQNPTFEEMFGADNPIGTTGHNFPAQQFELFLNFIDFDNDGDLDLAIGEGGVEDEEIGNNGSNEFHLIENYGTVSSPYLYKNGDVIPQYDNATEPYPAFFDFDNDGDVDLFQGSGSGNISYFTNDNPAPVTSMNTTPLESQEATGSLVVDDQISITDSDNDEMSYALITITNFHVNDTLTFTEPNIDESADITSEFNDATGELRIMGRASRAYYQGMLRSLTYHFDQPPVETSFVQGPASYSAPQTQAINKTIRLQVFDTDLTAPITRVRPVVIGAGYTPPTIANTTLPGIAGFIVNLDLKTIIQDGQDADANLALSIANDPGSGAVASIDAATQILTVDYTGLPFTGTETMQITVTDTDGSSATNTITLDITNTAPAFADGNGAGVAGSLVNVDLSSLYSDADNNLVASTLAITAQPTSSAPANLSANVLTVDYTGRSFTGNDLVTVQVCDIAGVCTSADIIIDIDNNAPVFSPASGSIAAGGLATVDLSSLFSDVDNNLVLSTLEITAQPQSTAPALIDGSQNLIVNYATLQFVGTDVVTVQVCDIAGVCTTADVTIDVTNQAPVFVDGNGTGVAGGIATVELEPLVTDPDGNVQFASFSLVGNATSGIAPTFDSNNRLVANYSGVVFSGNDAFTIRVCDAAGACDESTIIIDVTNNIPSFSGQNQNVAFRGIASISLEPHISDNDNNVDLSSLRVVAQPASGAAASIGANNTLLVDYAGLNFASTENVTVEVCDFGGSCSQAVFAISVQNASPVINSQLNNAMVGSTLSIDLLQITSDLDNNLDPSTFVILEQPISKAEAQIIDGELVIDYSEVTFSGTDQMTIEVRDLAGARTEADIFVEVDVENPVVVYNAVAPNGSSEDNRYLKITGLAQKNHVTIYNRWGDLVYEAYDYDNESVRFEGRNNNGNELPSGTYYYKIEVEGQQPEPGFLVLKQ